MIAKNKVALDKPLFPLGQVVATPGALQALEESGESASFFLSQHHRGIWGEVDAEDREANDLALEEGSRLLSAYITSEGDKLWIITEADRSVSTLMLAEEY